MRCGEVGWDGAGAVRHSYTGAAAVDALHGDAVVLTAGDRERSIN